MNNEYTKKFWEYVSKQETKLGRKVYSWLDHDNLSNVITDGQAFWVELTWSGATFPKYVLDYIKRYMKKEGFTYLYQK